SSDLAAHPPAAAGADAAGGRRDHDFRLFPAVRRALRHYPQLAAAEHGQRAVLHVRGRLQVVEPRPRLGGFLPAVPDHPGHHRAAAARRAQAGAGMSGVGHSRWRMLQVNGALMVLAVLSLAPLLWMLSVSFMPRGGASHFPPPLLPSEATLDS